MVEPTIERLDVLAELLRCGQDDSTIRHYASLAFLECGWELLAEYHCRERYEACR